MKLTTFPLPAFEIPSGQISVMETGSQQFYQDIISLFVGQSDNFRLFDDRDEPLNVNKDVMWVGNPMYELNYNIAFIKAITKQLIAIMDDKTKTAIIDAEREKLRIVLESSFYLDVPLEVNNAISLESIIKSSGLRIDVPSDAGVCVRLNLLFKILMETNNQKLIVLTEISHFVDEQDFASLVEQVANSGLTILLIEFSENSRRSFFDKCRYYYVDGDLVDFR